LSLDFILVMPRMILSYMYLQAYTAEFTVTSNVSLSLFSIESVSVSLLHEYVLDNDNMLINKRL